jgi:protein-S-isoprenylcysteine O-methyltransferase Ste14
VKIALQFLASTVAGLVFFVLALFLPAGTWHYWQAWVFVAVFLAATMIPSLYLAARAPAALQRRMRAGPTAETRPAQQIIVSALFGMSIAIFVVSAFDHRFGWSSVPVWLVVAGDVLVAAGLLTAQAVVVQNNHAAATITVEADQPLVSTGLYGIVRHPMYSGALVMMVGTPLALGSLWGLLAVLAAVPTLVARIVDEEHLLVDELAGYREYQRKVPYRLAPRVW